MCRRISFASLREQGYEGQPAPRFGKIDRSWGGLPSTGAARHPLPVGEGDVRKLHPASVSVDCFPYLGHICLEGQSGTHVLFW
jgi:hypothetical protein